MAIHKTNRRPFSTPRETMHVIIINIFFIYLIVLKKIYKNICSYSYLFIKIYIYIYIVYFSLSKKYEFITINCIHLSSAVNIYFSIHFAS